MAPKKNKKDDFAAWQPDFRIAEDLPDIKAVRTDFLVNIASVTLAVVLIGWLVYREANISDLEEQTAALVDIKERSESENRRVVGLNARFMKEKQILDDLDRFYNTPFDIPQLFADIAQIRPAEIAFEDFSFREDTLVNKDKKIRVYRVEFRGQTQSLEVVDDFKDAFENLPYLSELDVAITEGANPRNPALGTFGFSLRVLLEPTK